MQNSIKRSSRSVSSQGRSSSHGKKRNWENVMCMLRKITNHWLLLWRVKGHLASMCRSVNSRNAQKYMVEEVCNTEDTIYSSDSISPNDKCNVKPTYIKLLVGNIPIGFEADSGFAHTVISEKL